MAFGRISSIRSELDDPMQNGLGFVQNTHIFGGKRVVVSNCCGTSYLGSPFSTPLRKRSSRRSHSQKSNHLEKLPQDILVRILCKVNHSDLKELILVSKFVNEAALIARKSHFAFSTPSSKPMFNRNGDLEDSDLDRSVEAPNAPKQYRVAKSRIDGKSLSSISVALFASPKKARNDEL